MGEIFEKYKTAILLVVLVGGGYLGYTYFFSGSSNSQTITPGTGAGGEVVVPVGQEMLALLNDLQSIKFDPAFPDDPTYKSLVDFSTPLIPQQKGRPNPFLPILGGSSK